MRSLYQCGNARVNGDKVACSEGHKLSARKDGSIDLEQVALGERPLEFGVCQGCADYDHFGDPVAREDRGWLNAS